MTCSTPERSDGLELLKKACEVVEEKIKASGGNFAIQMAPKVVTATDEDELAARIKRAEEENAEVEGDDDDEEQVGMGGNKDVGMETIAWYRYDETNQRIVLSFLNQSEMSIIFSQPIRDDYYIVSTNQV